MHPWADVNRSAAAAAAAAVGVMQSLHKALSGEGSHLICSHQSEYGEQQVEQQQQQQQQQWQKPLVSMCSAIFTTASHCD
jgi:hypothetical protein